MAQANGAIPKAKSQSKKNSSSRGDSNTVKEETCLGLQKLCYYMNDKKKGANLNRMYKFALDRYNHHKARRSNFSITDQTEDYWVERVARHLEETGGSGSVLTFRDNCRHVKEWGAVANVKSVLMLFMELCKTEEVVDPFKEILHVQKVCTPCKEIVNHTSTMVVNENYQLQKCRGDQADVESVLPLVPLPHRHVLSVPEVSDTALIKELVYTFQGIDGKIIRYDPIIDGYNLDSKVNVGRSSKNMVMRMTELSWLHNKIRGHTENWANTRLYGIVAQGLNCAMRAELTEYYRLLAMIEAEIPTLTLLKLLLWTRTPQHRFTWLATVADNCEGLRGGVLASAVHGFTEHGDPRVTDMVKILLSAVVKPIFHMLGRWVMDGELDDPYGEFFIAGNNEIHGVRLWHEKYQVRKELVPSFIPMEMSEKILATGKSINFLREVCKDRVELRGRDELNKALQQASPDALYDPDDPLTALINAAYLETSKRVIDVLTGKYHFWDHLQAFRKYLLLGQGDFIHYLMELLEPELDKAGPRLSAHNLSGILGTSVRSTNAQFESQDVLERLDVRILEQTPGECGWNVFTLDYHIDGPIGTVFAPTTTSYLLLFQSLWKAKRIEWVLSRLWKKQVTASKNLSKIVEMVPVSQQVHLLTSEMVHFVHQMQYYMLFEVVECCWSEMVKNVGEAESLDDVIKAHAVFLTKTKQGVLLDPSTLDISIQLRAMYETILQLKVQVDLLHSRAQDELDRRTRREQLIEKRGAQGQFGTSAADELIYETATHTFLHQFLPNVRIQLKTLSISYQNCVRKLLLLLATSSDVSLQLLGFRLDFNGTYKRSDPLLLASLTHQQRRLSEIK